MKDYIIFNQRLAGYLMQQGFILLNMKESKSNKGKNVFVFRESQELLNAVDNYKSTK